MSAEQLKRLAEEYVRMPTSPKRRVLHEAIDQITSRAALGNAGEVVKWTPVSERLPESNTPVLASVTGELGKKYVIRATYAAEKTVEAGEDDAACTYDEDTDTYWVDAGWYEDNSECEVNYAVSGVTDWMPLPSPAGSTLTYADTPAVAGDTHAFKNFHRSLCDRFGYEHDEVNWRRDLLSLEEWIASTKAPVLTPLADGKVMAFVNIGGGQWQARECVLTPLAAAELAAQHASPTKAPAVAAEPVGYRWRFRSQTVMSPWQYGESRPSYAERAGHDCDPLYTHPPASAADALDAERLDAIAAEYFTLDSFAMQTGGDDADVGWRVLQHHCGEEKPRVVAEVYRDDPRAAIDAAMAQGGGS
jgi:hypothetical protein